MQEAPDRHCVLRRRAVLASAQRDTRAEGATAVGAANRADPTQDGRGGMRLRRYGGWRAAQSELCIQLRVAVLGRVDDDPAGLHPAIQLLYLGSTEPVGGREDKEQT